MIAEGGQVLAQDGLVGAVAVARDVPDGAGAQLRRRPAAVLLRGVREGAAVTALLEVDELRTHFLTGRGRGAGGRRGCRSPSTGDGRSASSASPASGKDGAGALDHGPAAGGEPLSRGGTVTFERAPADRHVAIRAAAELWGAELSMVFQDPMTSLNPVVRIGRQITETMRFQPGHPRRRGAGAGDGAAPLGGHPPSRSGAMREYPAPALGRAMRQAGHDRDRPRVAGPGSCWPTSRRPRWDVTVQAQILGLLGRQQRERFMAMILVTPRPRSRRRTHGRHRRDVCRPHRRAGADAGAVLGHADAVHAGAVPLHPRASRTRGTGVSSRIGGRPPEPDWPGPRLQLRAPAADTRGSDASWTRPPLMEAGPGHSYACWYPRRGRRGRSRSPRRSVSPPTGPCREGALMGRQRHGRTCAAGDALLRAGARRRRVPPPAAGAGSTPSRDVSLDVLPRPRRLGAGRRGPGAASPTFGRAGHAAPRADGRPGVVRGAGS